MKFRFEKLGCIEKAEIELGDLTILCGDNNTGKTYISYAIYGFLEIWNESIDFKDEEKIRNLMKNGFIKIDLKSIEDKILNIIDNLCKEYTGFISSVFSANEDYFSKTVFSVPIGDYKPTYEVNLEVSAGNKEGEEFLKIYKDRGSSILEVILPNKEKNFIPPINFLINAINEALGLSFFGEYFLKPFMISSERSGISLFYKELDISKNVLVEKLQEQRKAKIEISDFFEMINNSVSRYARPIKDGIDFVRDIENICKKKSLLIKEHPELEKDLNKIAGGDYKVKGDQILFSFKRGRKIRIIPLHMASSTAKSLSDLNFYIKHLAKKGHILMIDEPELNLHPANQRRMARLFVKLIKAGIKVFVTTHSDYFIKELNNLIILGNKFDDKAEIMKKYGYTEEDVLDRTKVKLYIAEKNTLKSAPINELGIEVDSFDREIREMNDMFDDMTETMDIAYE